jgi:hypothetical protein
MASTDEDDNFQDVDEPETTLQELVGEERSPVEESFYESYIIQSRTAVDNLYASNVLSCQKHMKVMGDLARQRKVKLSSLEREQKKLLKRMENLKEKQEIHLQKRSKTNDSKSKSAKVEQTETADKFNRTNRRRGSLPPLITDTKDHTPKMVKSSDRLSVPGNILSKSCNDLTPLYNRDSPSQESTLVLPAIKSSRSYENLLGTPFITHISSKVHQRMESRDSKSSWDEKNFKTQISTKVKWVPRN